MVFREHYVVARCERAEPDRAGWTAVERALIDDIRWWTLEDLAATSEPVHPPGLVEQLPSIIAGQYPATPQVLAGASSRRDGGEPSKGSPPP